MQSNLGNGTRRNRYVMNLMQRLECRAVIEEQLEALGIPEDLQDRIQIFYAHDYANEAEEDDNQQDSKQDEEEDL